jgi:excisionase family DNA binding protein
MTQNEKTAKVQKPDLQRTAYSVTEIAASVGCSTRTIWREIHAGKLRCIKVSSRVLVTATAFDDYLKKNLVRVR